MKKAFLTLSIDLINKYNPNYDNGELAKIKYGLEAMYLTVTKFIIILLISLILNITKEFIVFIFFYNFVRLFAFGMHASKSYLCLLSSIIIFILIPYVSNIFPNNNYINLAIGFFCITMMILYAPADTYKRPLIGVEKRLHLKLMSILISITYLIISLIIKDDFISNCLIAALLLETLIILPITYKLFNMPYNNYKNYKPKNI